jgi:hypothetical protein
MFGSSPAAVPLSVTPVDYYALLAELARQRQGGVEAAQLEIILWALVRGAQRVEARTRRHPVGIELLVTVDGELSSACAFKPADTDAMEATAATVRIAFEQDGWIEPGPRAV